MCGLPWGARGLVDAASQYCTYVSGTAKVMMNALQAGLLLLLLTGSVGSSSNDSGKLYCVCV